MSLQISKWVLKKQPQNRLYSLPSPNEFISKITFSSTHTVTLHFTESQKMARVIEGSDSYIQGVIKGIYLCTGEHLIPQVYES